MATVSGTLKTYDQVGKKEDVQDLIYMISPTKTPFISSIGTSTASNTLHQWQTDELAAVGTNAQVEGADAPTGTELTTTMLTANTQIFSKTVQTSGTANAVATYGRAKEDKLQVLNRGQELKRDIEHAMVGAGQAGTAGNNTTARQLTSAQNQISSATTESNSGTNRTFTETILTNVLEKCYNEGGEPNLIMVTPSHSKIVADFAAASGRNRDFGTGKTVVRAVNLYVSPYGEHSVVLNRFLDPNTVLALDTEYWSKAVLRPMQTVQLAPTGDSVKTQLLEECTLVCKSPKASGLASDLTA